MTRHRLDRTPHPLPHDTDLTLRIINHHLTHPVLPPTTDITLLLDTYLHHHDITTDLDDPASTTEGQPMAEAELNAAGGALVVEIEAFLVGVTLLTSSARGGADTTTTEMPLYQVTLDGTDYAIAISTVTTTTGPALRVTAPGPDNHTPYLPNGTYTLTLTYTDHTTQTHTATLNRRAGETTIVIPTHHTPDHITRLAIRPHTDV